MGKKTKSKGAKKKAAATSTGPGPGGNNNKNKKKNKQSVDPFGAEPISQKNNNNDNEHGFHSIYQVYKTATLRFKEQLTQLVPANIFKNDYVQSFLDAADHIEENDIAVNDDLLTNLRVAISVRKKYSRRLEDGGDEGHAYFLLVLNYCLQVLKRCSCSNKNEVSVNDSESGNMANDAENENVSEKLPNETFLNRFGALSVGVEDIEHESDSEEENKLSAEVNDQTPMDRPQPPSDKTYTYEDLMSFPDKAKCLFLFDTMAYHGSKISAGMKNLKETMRMEANNEYPTENVPAELILLGALANAMILDVQNLESSLYLECPSLGESPYRILACCFISPFIKLAGDNVRMYSPLARKFKDEMALTYIGDIIEAVFRCDMNEPNKIAERWSSRWRLPEHWRMKARWLASLIVRHTMQNCMTVSESKMYPMDPDEGLRGREMPDWVKDNEAWEMIGGEFSIFNTMKLLDMFGSNLNHNDKKGDHVFNHVMAHVMNQVQWDEDDNPASSIRGDMDAILVKMFMCILNSKWRLDGCAVPNEKGMLPQVHVIRKWTREGMKSKPSFALIFSLHIMMLSIFELQGDGDVSQVGSIAKSAYAKFMSQIEEHSKLDIPCQSQREEYLKIILDTRRVTERSDGCDLEKMKDTITLESFDLLFWNPLCAGLFLGYNTVYLNLRGGLAAMSTTYDVNAILHIYNALKVRGMVDDDLPLLGDLDRCFDQSKFFWNGWEKPPQGKFTYRFHLSMGSTNEMAVWSQNMAKFKFEGGETPPSKPSITMSKLKNNKKMSTRVAESIDPAVVSETYKRFCAGDYHDMAEALQDPMVPKHLKINPECPFPMTLQIFDAKNYLVCIAMASELDNLLKYNMTAVGSIFSEFLFETFHPDKNESIAMFQARADLPCDHPGDIRTLVNLAVAEEVIANLDYGQDMHDNLGEAFEEFFYNLDMDRVCLY